MTEKNRSVPSASSGALAVSSARAASPARSVSSANGDGGAESDAEFDDADYIAALEEIEELGRHLGMRQRAGGSHEARPTSGSEASTALGSSTIGETVSTADTEEMPAEVSACDMHLGAQRIHFELQQQGIPLPQGMRIETSAATLSQFFITFNVGEGPYMPTALTFWLKVFNDFPSADSFRLRCTTRVFHPFVNPESGRVNLPIDFAGWRGSGSLRFLLDALRRLFISPAEQPISSPVAVSNEAAAALLQSDADEFRRTIRLTLAGGTYRGVKYDSMHSSASTQQHRKSAPSPPDSSPLARGATPDAITVEVMRLEVMKEQYKQAISNWMRDNSVEIADLGPARSNA
jgi:ubiquitin-protein ligase